MPARTGSGANASSAASQVDQAENMMEIPAGWFEMGSETGSDFEQPVHRVYIDAFKMDRTPVTNQQFSVFIDATGYRTTAEVKGKAWGFDGEQYRDIEDLNWRTYSTRERDNHPVVLVSWNDAQAYCSWAGKRLPTEAEWEKAARGGLVNQDYPWGSEEPDLERVGFSAIAKAESLPGTFEVQTYAPNDYGLYDMVGNVWQWCSDVYRADYYANSPERNPSGAWNGHLRVRRGGAWNVIQAFRLRCANRGAVKAETVVPNMGFRCAL